MTLIICQWSNRYFKVINIQQYSLCFVTAFTSGKKNARNNCLTSNLTFKPGFMTCKILTFSGYSHFPSTNLKISQEMIEILFLGVKSDVRSALNRLNTN